MVENAAGGTPANGTVAGSTAFGAKGDGAGMGNPGVPTASPDAGRSAHGSMGEGERDSVATGPEPDSGSRVVKLADAAAASGSGWYSNDAATFGDRVAAAREALGLSQSGLARKLGVKTQTIAAWEDDLREPRANRLQMLSGVLNVSLMWLLNGEGDGLPDPEANAELGRDVNEILAEFRQVKGVLAQSADKLAALEKRLRRALRDMP